jgi:hypothetical protein
MIKHMNNPAVFFIALTALAPCVAWAYLDPGSGSLLLQVVLGGVAAVGVVAKLYWYKILRVLGLGNKKQADE